MGGVGCCPGVETMQLGAVHMGSGSGSQRELQRVDLRTGCLTGCGVQGEGWPGQFLGSGSGTWGWVALNYIRHCRKHETRQFPVLSVRQHASSSLIIQGSGPSSVTSAVEPMSQMDLPCSELSCRHLPPSRTYAPTNAALASGWPLPQGHTRGLP